MNTKINEVIKLNNNIHKTSMVTQQATTSDIRAVWYWLKHPPNGYSYP